MSALFDFNYFITIRGMTWQREDAMETSTFIFLSVIIQTKWNIPISFPIL